MLLKNLELGRYNPPFYPFFFNPFSSICRLSHELYEKKGERGKRGAFKKETERESEAHRVRAAGMEAGSGRASEGRV